jgi:hypothetical protein
MEVAVASSAGLEAPCVGCTTPDPNSGGPNVTEGDPMRSAFVELAEFAGDTPAATDLFTLPAKPIHFARSITGDLGLMVWAVE